MTVIPLAITVDWNDSNVCGSSCMFLNYPDCALFNCILEDTELPKGWEWNDCAPTKQRCYQCMRCS